METPCGTLQNKHPAQFSSSPTQVNEHPSACLTQKIGMVKQKLEECMVQLVFCLCDKTWTKPTWRGKAFFGLQVSLSGTDAKAGTKDEVMEKCCLPVCSLCLAQLLFLYKPKTQGWHYPQWTSGWALLFELAIKQMSHILALRPTTQEQFFS